MCPYWPNWPPRCRYRTLNAAQTSFSCHDQGAGFSVRTRQNRRLRSWFRENRLFRIAVEDSNFSGMCKDTLHCGNIDAARIRLQILPIANGHDHHIRQWLRRCNLATRAALPPIPRRISADAPVFRRTHSGAGAAPDYDAANSR